MKPLLNAYFEKAAGLPLATEVTSREGTALPLGDAFASTLENIKAIHESGNVLRFIGNGGSASIASHMAVDFSKRGGIRANALNDPSMLTCLGNDLGYEEVFSHQLGLHIREGDLLVAISSSGASDNILRGVNIARDKGALTVTLSGFNPENPLRGLGDVNYYVNSSEYGFVELTHMALLSAMIDLLLGWHPDRPLNR
ncbi:MAG: SIS domain-containing protein [Rhodospirillaceae bacterium]|jgi:D-sedoheptulose 7-phosphate isomerase|nr:SIS domain-containing protein [Rhodospirillaceae bacterium]MBT5374400.1 SIS domain-containing protein [Rhodospirillaceae bacterium]MBT5752096.1 SIS domain-containing protein [Rhodospirillaceae bacterium]